MPSRKSIVVAAVALQHTVFVAAASCVPGLKAEDVDLRKCGFKRAKVSDRDYWGSNWGQLIKKGLHRDDRTPAGRKFVRRFRVTPDQFDGLVAEVNEKGWWPYKPTDAAGRPAAPVELLVLGVLRILGRACTFDDLEELSNMSEETHRRFFEAYTDESAADFRRECAEEHHTPDYIKESERVFRANGFPGCVAAIDCVHVPWGMCPTGLKGAFTGKEGFATVSYEVSTNQLKRITHCEPGFAGTCNDITISKSDYFITQLKENPVYTEMEFELQSEDGVITEQGAYSITDGGYINWRVLQAPMRITDTLAEAAYYQQLVSTRKSVECTFGILKQRFRILKVPMLFRTKARVDAVMFTCCRLHDMLHDDSGQRTKFDDVFEGAWSEGELAAIRQKLRKRVSLAKMVERIVGVDFDASGTGAKGCHTKAERAGAGSGYRALQRKLIINLSVMEKNGDLMHMV